MENYEKKEYLASTICLWSNPSALNDGPSKANGEPVSSYQPPQHRQGQLSSGFIPSFVAVTELLNFACSLFCSDQHGI